MFIARRGERLSVDIALDCCQPSFAWRSGRLVSRASTLHDPQRDYDLRSGLNMQLVIDRVQVSFHGAFAHTQFFRNRPIGKPATDQRRNLLLTFGQCD